MSTESVGEPKQTFTDEIWLSAQSAHRPAAASSRSPQPYVSSLPLTPSFTVKTIRHGGALQRGQLNCESFKGKLRDELLNGEIFYTLKEAQIMIEVWRRHYNTIRPHSSLGYCPPEALIYARPLALQ